MLKKLVGINVSLLICNMVLGSHESSANPADHVPEFSLRSEAHEKCIRMAGAAIHIPSGKRDELVRDKEHVLNYSPVPPVDIEPTIVQISIQDHGLKSKETVDKLGTVLGTEIEVTDGFCAEKDLPRIKKKWKAKNAYLCNVHIDSVVVSLTIVTRQSLTAEGFQRLANILFNPSSCSR